MKDDRILWPCDIPSSVKTILLDSARLHVIDSDDCMTIGKGNSNGLFYVIEGMVIVGMPNLSRSSPFVVFRRGDWFGGTVIFHSSDFEYSIASIECSQICFIPGQVIRDAAEQHPALYKLLYLVTSERTRAAIDMLFVSSGMTMTQKVAYFLMKVSRKFSSVEGAIPMISMSQSMVAQMLGLSRLSLSEQLHLLEHKGLISLQRKKIFILDIQALQELTAP